MSTNMMNENNRMKKRLPAEWEDYECVMLAWPHENSDWAYILEDARNNISEIVKAISKDVCVMLVGPADLCKDSIDSHGFNPERVRFFDVPTNDTWARDFGPICIENEDGNSILDFKFNGWGLKFPADKDNLITSGLHTKGVFKCHRENRLNFVLEGGSIESDGHGTILTTSECLLSPNRNGQWTEDQISEYLSDSFGCQHVIFLHHGSLIGDDTDSHIDTLARLAPENTILYCGAGEEDNPNHESLIRMRQELEDLRTIDGNAFNLIELPLPDPIEIDGEILPATYANFLVTPHYVLMPSYRQPQKDFLASQIIKIAYPDREVMPIDCVTLVRQHGSLHCVTMQLPKGVTADIASGKWI